MDILQTAAVVTANVILPGSGVLVNSGFELAKICFQITQVLSGMEETASAIKTQSRNIMEDVDEFSYVLELLDKRVQHQERLTDGLRKTILRFENEVKEYNRVVNKFSRNKNLLKQLVYHRDVEAASVIAKKIGAKLVVRLNLECSIDGSSNHGLQEHLVATKTSVDALDQTPGSGSLVADCNRVVRSLTEQLEERDKRYMDFVDSPEVMKEMSDADNQKEILAIITHIGRRNDAMMQSSLGGRDRVLSVMKEKLWANSSRSIRADVNNLPDWYITEDEIDVDMTTIVGFGGDAKIYKGELTGDTPVAVKIFNANVKQSDEAKQKFIDTMKLWERLRHHNNICRLYGACYLTATPFVVMEFCDMGPLDKFLRQDERNRYKFTLEILAQAAQGIIKMHSIGIVHGDLKCDNILVTGSTRQAKVCDFDRSFDWIALKNKRLVNGTAADAGIEISDAVRYLAPECVEGMLPNAASDVYSFGMTLYQALIGESPYFDISNDIELRACKLARELPAREGQMINDGAWELITQCCDPTSHQRPTMEKVLKALKSLASKHQQLTEGANEHQLEMATPPVNPVEEPCEPESVAQAIKAQVNAAMDVQAPAAEIDQVSVVVSMDGAAQLPVSLEPKPLSPDESEQPQTSPTVPKSGDMTPVKSANKARRVISRSHKIIGVAFLALIVIGVIVIIVVTSKSSSATAASQSSGTETGSNSSGSSSGTGNSTPIPTPGSSPAPTPTTTATTVVPVPVATPAPLGTTLAPTDAVTPAPVAATPVPAAVTPTPPAATPVPVAATPAPTTATTPAPTPPPTLTPTTATTPAPTPPPTPAPLVAKVSTIVGYGSSFSTSFSGLSGVVVASNNYIYLSDENRILRMTDGSDASVYSGSLSGGYQDGARASATYAAPRALALSSSGDLFICDYGNAIVRKIAGGSTVSTFSSFTAADLRGIAIDSSGTVYVSVGNSKKVTKINSAGVASTFWTSTIVLMGVAVDASGNVYITDMHAVRKLTSSGTMTVLAGSSTSGFMNGVGSAARFSSPKALTIGSDGDLYVADTGNNCIRKVSLSTTEVTTYAGDCTSYGSTDGVATSAKFDSPRGIAAATNSVFYVTDGSSSQERVRRICLG